MPNPFFNKRLPLSYLYYVLFCIPLLLTASSVTRAGDSVGVVPGSFEVSNSGAATYTVPIEVPPGVAGMQPNIAIAYDSNSRSTDPGIGWSLSAVSAISRCGSDLIRDNVIDGADYDSSDNFCYSGSRLINVSGQHGEDGSLYRTESGGFSQIQIKGQNGGNATFNPGYFIVHNANGRKDFYGADQYGQTDDSRLYQAGSSNIFYWMLKESVDVFGNSIKYHYENSNSGEHYLTSIEYSNYFIEFQYETVITLPAFIAPNTETLNNKITTSIEVYTQGSSNPSYQYNFIKNSVDQLHRIDKCVSGVCRSSAEFIYSGGEIVGGFSSSQAAPATWVGSKTDLSRFLTGDFNGDGKTDIYQINGWNSSAEDTVWLSTGNGAFNPVNSGVNTWVGGSFESADLDLSRIKTGDFNGDGYHDIYQINGWNNSANDSVWLSNRDGTFTLAAGGPSTYVGGTFDSAAFDIARIRFADFNGDGKTDMYQINGWAGAVSDIVWLSSGNGTFTKVTGGPSTSVGSSFEAGYLDFSRILFADFNGDGMADLYQVNGWNSSTPDSVWFSNGNGGFTQTSFGPNTYISGGDLEAASTDVARIKIGDFNADGLADIYMISGWGSNPMDKYWLSRGNGSFDVYEKGIASFVGSSYESAGLDLNRYHFLDMNGDGRTDIYQINGWAGAASDSVWYAQKDGNFILANGGPMTSIGNSFETASIDASRFRFGDFNGDGTFDVYHIAGFNQSVNDWVYFGQSEQVRLVEIDSVMSESIYVSYESMTAENHYTRDPNLNLAAEETDRLFPIHIVSEVRLSGGNIDKTIGYSYSGLKSHTQGFGSLGFRSMDVYDASTGHRTETTFSQDWGNRSVGYPITERVYTGSGVDLSKTVNNISTYINGAVSFSFIAASNTTKRDFNGALIGTFGSESMYDNSYDYPYGYVKTKETSCVSESSANVVAEAAILCDSMILKSRTVVDTNYYLASQFGLDKRAPLLQSQMTNSSVFDVELPFGTPTSETRKVEFDYFYNSGVLKSETVQPDEPSISVKKEYTYNSQGLLDSTTVSGGSGSTAITPRTSTNLYETSGLYRLIEKQNALGHNETYTYDNTFPWMVKTITGPNNLTSTNHYNTFGELTKVVRPNNTSTETTKEWCSSNTVCASIPNAHFYSKVSSTDTADIYTFYDSLGREIQRYQNSLTSASAYAPLRKTTEYNALGQVSRVSDPFFNVSDAIYTTSTYDSLGRPSTVTSPDTSQVTFNYNGLTTTKTFIPADGSGGNQVSTVVKNALGQNEKTIDNDGNELHFDYDAFGNLVRTTDPQGNTVEIEYDLRGRKIKMDDPDQGIWTYTYYADGKLRTQTDAKNQTTTNTYDLLGRMITRVDGDGTSQWIYDNCAYGKGKLCRVEHNNGYQKTYTYNTLGLADTTVTTIPGQSTLSQQVTYDSSSRVNTVSYPGGFTTQNIYHPHTGTLLEVKNANTNQSLWQANEFNAKGQLSVFKQGELTTTRVYNADTGRLEEQRVMRTGAELTRQNYTWLSNGNLDHKSDHWKNNSNNTIDDYYQYDSLNRLTSYQTLVASNQTDYITVDYNELGNIEYKSDVGHYSYNNGRPHAVSNVSSKGNYTYDANGNMTAGDGRTLYYTSFNKPDRIVKGNFDTRIDYGPNRSRYKRQDIKNGSTISTIYYAGAYEKEIKGSTTIERVTLGGHTILEKKNGTQATYHTIRDHLGSLVATIKSGSSNDTRTSFDPWGKRRTAGLSGDMLSIDDVSVMNSVTQRGFTGHEELVGVGLIHMNGRVFDPEIARFLSADPHIQAPSNLQSYNRYSYVINNPLKYTDPSGYFFKKLKRFVKKYWRPIVAIVATVFTAGAASSAYMSSAVSSAGGLASASINLGAIKATGAAIGAISGGFVGGAISSGSLKGAALGAFTGGLLHGVGSKFSASNLFSRAGAVKTTVHGVVGGFNSVLSGGKFGHGFASMGFTQGANLHFGGVGHAGSALIGGMASELAGGSFRHGAIQGVFSHALNDCLHGQPCSPFGDVKDRMVSGIDKFKGYLNNFKQCHAKCISSNYGSSYEVASALSPLTVSGVAGTLSTSYLEGVLNDRAVRNSYEITNNQAKNRVFSRQARTLSQFRSFNAASLVIGAGAFGYTLGADSYCSASCY